MKRIFLLAISGLFLLPLSAQNTMTPELLWKLGRVTGLGIGSDANVYYSVSTPDWEENKSSSKLYKVPIQGGPAIEVKTNPLQDKNVSPDKKYMLSHKEVKVSKVSGTDFYPELTKSNAQIYNDLMIRHWDTWEDGAFDHVIVSIMDNGVVSKTIDVMRDEPDNCPLKPFGGDEDYIWGPDYKTVLYVTKKKTEIRS